MDFFDKVFGRYCRNCVIDTRPIDAYPIRVEIEKGNNIHVYGITNTVFKEKAAKFFNEDGTPVEGGLPYDILHKDVLGSEGGGVALCEGVNPSVFLLVVDTGVGVPGASIFRVSGDLSVSYESHVVKDPDGFERLVCIFK